MAKKDHFDEFDGFSEWEGAFRMRNRRHMREYPRHHKAAEEKGEYRKRKPPRHREPAY